jgi:hypothetical protein
MWLRKGAIKTFDETNAQKVFALFQSQWKTLNADSSGIEAPAKKPTSLKTRSSVKLSIPTDRRPGSIEMLSGWR